MPGHQHAAISPAPARGAHTNPPVRYAPGWPGITPWGFAKGDEDLGGYHLVWPRDLVEAASGLLAAGGGEEAHRVLQYLQVTQEPDGHWAQNMWMDGTPYWNGIQMDETALPILLVDQARRGGGGAGWC
jgi:hypothetical protein